MNPQIDQIIVALTEVIRQIGPCHTRAWWPVTVSVGRSTVGGNKTRDSGPMLAPGDPASYHEYEWFIRDCNGLRVHVNHLLRVPVGPIRLTARDSPVVVEARLRMVIERLRGYATRQRVNGGPDQVDLDLITAATGQLILRQEAILSRPRVPVSIPCKHAGERERCTGWAVNRKRRLCRSCENHEQYKRVRSRGVRA